MVKVTFRHYGYPGSLTISDPLNVSKIQECITLANREVLLKFILRFLIDFEVHRTCESNNTKTAIQIAERHKISEVIVCLKSGERVRVV